MTTTQKTVLGPSNETHKIDTQGIKKLAQLIKGIKVAMLTTVDPEGRMHSRPMMTQERDFQGALWFFSREHSEQIHDIAFDQHVNVAYADSSSHRYGSVSGIARRVTDRSMIAKLWHAGLKEWFPGGQDDPELTLIRVDVESAELWTSHGNFERLYSIGAAAIASKDFRGVDPRKLEIPEQH